MSWLSRLFNAFHPDRVASDIDRELAFHLAERADALQAAGMEPDAARNEARRRFGNYGIQRETTRERDIAVGVETVISDVRYALRSLLARPGFTTAAVLSLSLGIGANTAIFTLVNTAMLKSLPVDHAEELVEVTVTGSAPKRGSLRTALWQQLRNRQDVFSSMFTYGSTSVDLATGGEARPISLGFASGSLFPTLGVGVALGRGVAASDDYPGCPAVAVITHGFWDREYSRRGVVGKVITLTGQPFRIIGVAEPAFFGIEYGYDVPVWVPQCTETLLGRTGTAVGRILGRLRPGVTIEQASARISAMAPSIIEASLPAGISASEARQLRSTPIEVTPFANGIQSLAESYGKALFVLMALVGLVLLVACANIANLLLARATARRREIAIRLALGASRLRLLRQLLTESAVLSLFSTALGLLFAFLGARLLVGFLSPRLVVSLDLSPDRTVLAFTIAVGIATGLLFGLAPAWRAVRVDPQRAMTPVGRGIAEGQTRFGLGQAIVIGQVALSLVAIAGAGLLLSSWRRLATLDPGFKSDHVLVVRLDTRAAQTPADQRTATFARILERLRTIPGVRSASGAALTPMGASRFRPLVIDVVGAPLIPEDKATVDRDHVSSDYFSTLGARLLAGRDFDRRDRLGSPVVAIVNEELARRLFGNATPIGRYIRRQSGAVWDDPIEIVGLAANTKQESLREANQPIVYFSIDQIPQPEPGLNFLLHSDGPLTELIPTAKAAIAAIDPRFSLSFVTLDEQIQSTLRLPRTLGLLSGFFGALALLLAAIGLYGLVAYTVARRRNEIGIRIALGAAPMRILRMVVGDTGRLVASGVVIGLAVSFAVTKTVSSFLFGVTPNDPATLACSTLALAIVGLIAAFVPASRAARLNPVTALRND